MVSPGVHSLLRLLAWTITVGTACPFWPTQSSRHARPQRRPRRRQPPPFTSLATITFCLIDFVYSTTMYQAIYAKSGPPSCSHDSSRNAFAMLRPFLLKKTSIFTSPMQPRSVILGETDLELEVDGESRVANTHFLSVSQEFIQLALQVGSSLQL